MASRAIIHIVLLLGCAALTACQRVDPNVGSAKAPIARADTAGINWIKGDVSAAFSIARQQHKPVLLYWGASWCPPCHQLKATVFTQPGFIAKTRLFVPVYLDGDEAGAQKWGDKFGVQGYPTLVILDADQREIMRISGGMDLNQYATVLDIALGELEPIDRSLLDSNTALNANTCARLAFNAWALNDIESSQLITQADQLANLARRCSAITSLAAARLSLFSAYFRARAESEDNPHTRTAMCNEVVNVLAIINRSGKDMRLADALQTLDEHFFKVVRHCNQTIWQPLRDAYVGAMDAAANNPNLAAADQISALNRKLLVSRVLTLDGKCPEQYVANARARINTLLAQQQTPFVRSSILNSVLNVYDELGLNQESYDLIRSELPQAEHPYYLKADLAEVAEKLGRQEEALHLWDEAYRESQGTATRFQWGQSYVAALIRMQPKDSQQIAIIAAQTLGELDGPDRIYRRARLRLQRLDKDLRNWNDAANHQHDDVLKTLHAHMQQVCIKIPVDDAARVSCDKFLAT